MQQATTTVWDLRSLSLQGPFVFLTAFLLYFLAFLIPFIKLLRRTGHSIAWSLLALIPGLNLLALWVFAFKPWPTDKN